MFPLDNPQSGPATGNGFTTSAILQQNTNLLGAPQVQTSAMSQGIPNFNTNTAPASSTTNPVISNMVKALKGS
jgi:hypothetical protein